MLQKIPFVAISVLLVAQMSLPVFGNNLTATVVSIGDGDYFLNSKFKIQNAKLRINKNFELIILRVRASTALNNQWRVSNLLEVQF